MDAPITAAARALATGDVLAALGCVALREDPPALALRGIAMAQLGQLHTARELLRRARRAFGPHETVARARCRVAEAEVALAMRELSGPSQPLQEVAALLDARGDEANALQAWLILARRWLLLGRLRDAEHGLAQLADRPMPPALEAMAQLTAAALALRALHVAPARAALARAQAAADRAGIAPLRCEVDEAIAALDRPAARSLQAGVARSLRIDDVPALLASGALVVDACRRGLRTGTQWHCLARRPVLFALLRALAEAWPGGVERDVLIERVFGIAHPDDSLRVRLRVELGRLRALIAAQARIEATPQGFRIQPCHAQTVTVLLPPIDGEQAALVALLADGAAWSTSSLALAVGASQRSVQRALAELQAAGHVHTRGRGRAQRWQSVPLAGFTTILLLPAALPIG